MNHHHDHLNGTLGAPVVRGYSAYEVYVKNGGTLSESEWLAALKGEQGEKGDTGDPGVYIGTDEPTDENIRVWVDTNGGADELPGLKYVKDDPSDHGGVIEGWVNLPENPPAGMYINKASGNYSHAEGYGTIASGQWSHSENAFNTADGEAAHAEGYQTEAHGADSHSEGQYTKARSHASHAEGVSTTAINTAAHAEGGRTTASGQHSHAQGYGTTASGDCSHAEGIQSVANSMTAHAEGNGTEASGLNSHAEGGGTTASGNESHAEGYGTIANGFASHAEGDNTKALSGYQHVQGKYNIEDANDTYAHIVGGGNSDANRINIHTLDWTGNAVYAGKVTVGAQPTADNDLATKKYVDDNEGGGDTFVATFSNHETSGSWYGQLDCDKTYQEIYAAYTSGKNIVAVYSPSSGITVKSASMWEQEEGGEHWFLFNMLYFYNNTLYYNVITVYPNTMTAIRTWQTIFSMT